MDFEVDSFLFKVELNVKNIFIDVSTGNKTFEYYQNEKSTPTHLFFIFETPYHNAFAHWVFESAVFLPFVNKFVGNANFYVLVNKNEHRKYKELFFKLFNISSDRIWLIDNTSINSNDVAYQNIPENNTCIVCKNITLNTKRLPDKNSADLFKYLIYNFHCEVLKKVDSDITKTVDHLFLPRNKTENYSPNDRVINYSKCAQILKSVQYLEYDSNNTENYVEQITLLRKSKNIYTVWGSSHMVNGFFSKNSTIFVICNDTPYRYHNEYSLHMFIYDFIEKTNCIVII